MIVSTLLEKKAGQAVVTVRPEAPVVTVIHQLKLRNIGAVIVSADGEHILGLVSERDIARGLARHGGELLSMRASDLMTRSVATCGPQQNIKQVMADMTRLRVRHLPVVENGRLSGIISIGDVVKSLIDDMQLEVNVLRDAFIESH